MEYRITNKSSTLVNPISNAILERIHQVLVNLVRDCNITQTYVNKDDPWSGILAAAETTKRLKCYSPDQLLFGHDMIIPVGGPP